MEINILMEDKINILKELKKMLVSNFGKNISEVILFGSQAKGNVNEHSDYDILIVLKNDYDYDYTRQISDVCYEIDLKYDIFIDTKLISINELNNTLKGKYPLYLDALEEGIYA